MKKKLSDVCEIQQGTHIKSTDFDDNGRYVFLKLNDFAESEIPDKEGYTRTNNEVDSKFILKENDVLFSTRIKFNAYRLPLEGFDYIISSTFVILRPNDTILLSDYLYWYLNLPHVLEYVQKHNATGTKMPFISMKDLREMEIDVPSIDKQKKIIEINQLYKKQNELEQRLNSLKNTYIHSTLLKSARK